MEKAAVRRVTDLFSTKRKKTQEKETAFRDRLYQEIGRLQVELKWFKNRHISFLSRL